jgi:hemerythrin
MLAWDDALHGLGMAEMDATHREFIALVNLLAECDDADFAALFAKLLDHSRRHFTGEGRLMRISPQGGRRIRKR